MLQAPGPGSGRGEGTVTREERCHYSSSIFFLGWGSFSRDSPWGERWQTFTPTSLGTCDLGVPMKMGADASRGSQLSFWKNNRVLKIENPIPVLSITPSSRKKIFIPIVQRFELLSSSLPRNWGDLK